MATLTGALPELRAAYTKLEAYAKSQGIGITVADFGGVRTLADTTRILKYRDDDYAVALRNRTIPADTSLNKFRPIAPFGRSYHNYGAAFDVKIVSRPSNMTSYDALVKLGRYAPSVGLRWGGTFQDKDEPHFELPISLDEAKRRYVSSGGTVNAPPKDGFSLDTFDLSKLLPSLTPAATDPTLTEFPDVYGVAAPSESGELEFDDMPPDTGSTGILIVGVAVAGFVLWALRRHLA